MKVKVERMGWGRWLVMLFFSLLGTAAFVVALGYHALGVMALGAILTAGLYAPLWIKRPWRGRGRRR